MATSRGTAPQTPGYDARAYPPFAVTVDLVVLTVRDNALCALVVRRGEEPFAGRLALPGGFVRPDESLDVAALRELAEETGIADLPAHLEQLATYGAVDRDPRMRVVSVAYLALAPDLPAPRPGGDAAYATWLPASELLLPEQFRKAQPPYQTANLHEPESPDESAGARQPAPVLEPAGKSASSGLGRAGGARGDMATGAAGAAALAARGRTGPAQPGVLAFDHARILADGVERARAKLEYSPLAAAFCPPQFTVGELRRVYEAVWGVALDPRNFHRKVTGTPGFLVPVGGTTARQGGRPAQLFRRGDAKMLNPPMLRPNAQDGP